jgi:hypothetical protein
MKNLLLTKSGKSLYIARGKTMQKKKFSFLLVVLSFLFFVGCSKHNDQTQGTDSSSGGGSGSVIEFRSYMARANRLIQIYGAYVLTTEERNKIDAIFLSHIDIEPTHENLTKDGITVTALNYPHLRIKKIKYNEERWHEYDIRARLQTVVHELLGLADIKDPDYKMSNKIVSEDTSYKTLTVSSLPSDIVIAIARDETGVFDATLLPEKTQETVVSPTDFIETYYVQTYSLKMEPLKIRAYQVKINKPKGITAITLLENP